MKSKKLRGSIANLTRPPSSKSPIHNKLSGVFFSCRLSKRDPSLPDSSPYGKERIKLPIAECVDSHTHLFYNSHHYSKDRVCYANLVLVSKNDTEYAFCQANLIKLEMTANQLLKLDFQQNEFKYCDPSEFSLWVDVFMVGDMSLTDTNHDWDTVIDTGRHKPVQQKHKKRKSTKQAKRQRNGHSYMCDQDDGDANDCHSSDDSDNDAGLVPAYSKLSDHISPLSLPPLKPGS